MCNGANVGSLIQVSQVDVSLQDVNLHLACKTLSVGHMTPSNFIGTAKSTQGQSAYRDAGHSAPHDGYYYDR